MLNTAIMKFIALKEDSLLRSVMVCVSVTTSELCDRLSLFLVQKMPTFYFETTIKPYECFWIFSEG